MAARVGRPQLDIYGPYRQCVTGSGRFQVHELTLLPGGRLAFAATFEQSCGDAATLRGCIRVTQ